MKKEFEESSKNRSGALFFIVMEGNFSRGSNYENLSTASTVIFGVPFLNKYEPKIAAKIELGSLNMREKAEKKIKQSVGRVIRNPS